tara:strand:- start:2526 stop:3404 length:879 start_codon:yes stop_codon:yes gene_type:complete
MTDYFPILLALLIVVIGFVTSMSHGVHKLLISGCAAATAIALFFLIIHWVPMVGGIFSDTEIAWQILVGIGAASALIAYVISRIIFGLVIKWVLGADSSLNSLSDGVPGALLSLIPSLVGVFFLFTCARIAGTVLELNYTESLSREGIIDMVGKIPDYPVAAKWRNEIERLPLIPTALDLTDPFSNRANRNTGALVMIGRSGSLRSHVLADPSTAELAGNEEIHALTRDPAVFRVLETHDRVALVLNSKVREVASSGDLSSSLREFNLQRSLEGYVDSLEPVMPPQSIETEP